MRIETEAAPAGNLMNAVLRGPEGTPLHSLPQRRILWMLVFGWTVLVGFALWWLIKGNGAPSIWVFQQRDLDQPGFSERVQSIFRGELGLQRTSPWILFGPYLVLIAWYFPLERERLRRNLSLNAAACLAFVWACQAINFRASPTHARLVMVDSDYTSRLGTAPPGTNGFVPFRGMRPGGRFAASDEPIFFGPLRRPLPPPRSRKVSLRSTILDLLAYGAITGLVHSVNFYGRMRERERRALILESNLAHARLNTLKAQLQPHFLFNSLNAIAALLRRDPRLAESTLVALSELLRLALSQSERQEGALREELEFVRRYLEIQQTRFGDKLRVEQDIEPQALDCIVPTLVLQPLVENAIRHGIEPGEIAGVVWVSAAREDGTLVLTVEDDGVGLTRGNTDLGGPEIPARFRPNLPAPAQTTATRAALARAGTGIGLANLRDRLQALYGSRQKLQLTARAEGGVIVRVEIPWRRRAASETVDSFQG